MRSLNYTERRSEHFSSLMILNLNATLQRVVKVKHLLGHLYNMLKAFILLCSNMMSKSSNAFLLLYNRFSRQSLPLPLKKSLILFLVLPYLINYHPYLITVVLFASVSVLATQSYCVVRWASNKFYK